MICETRNPSVPNRSRNGSGNGWEKHNPRNRSRVYIETRNGCAGMIPKADETMPAESNHSEVKVGTVASPDLQAPTFHSATRRPPSPSAPAAAPRRPWERLLVAGTLQHRRHLTNETEA
jgi:hypothetical protein